MINGMVLIKESDPPTNITVNFTVPIVTCPSSDTSFALSHLLYDPGHNVGVSSGLHTGSVSGGTTGISAVATFNSNSRTTDMQFYAVNPLLDRYSASDGRGSPLDALTTASCTVCSRLKTKRKINLLLTI